MKRIIISLLLLASPMMATDVYKGRWSDIVWVGSGTNFVATWGSATQTFWQLPEYSSTVLWYKFDEATNASGRIVDNSAVGTNYASIWTNGTAPAWFAGSNGISDTYYFYGTTGAGMRTDMTTASSNNSFCCWIRAGAFINYQILLDYMSGRFVITRSGANATDGYGVYNASLSQWRYFSPKYVPTAGVWHQVCFVQTSATQLTMYVNNDGIARTVGQVALPLQGTNKIGNFYPDSASSGLQAYMDDFIIWTNTALTSAQVLDIYTNTWQTHGWSNSLALATFDGARSLWSNSVLEVLGEYNFPADTSYVGTNHMTLAGGSTDPAWRADGTNGYWLFDGAGDYMRTAYFTGITGAMPRTMAVWYKQTATNNVTGQMVFGQGAYVALKHLSIFYSKAQDRFCVANGVVAQSPSNVVPSGVGVWHHHCITYSGTSWSYYYDGEFRGSSNVILNTTNDVIGSGSLSTTASWVNGGVDDYYLMNVELSSNQVYSIYQSSTNRHPNP